MDRFETLYRTHFAAVYRFARRATGRVDLAEDVTSDAFLALHRNLDGIDDERLPAWLITVVRNRARDVWRRAAVEQRYAPAALEPTAPPPVPVQTWLLDSADLKPVHRACVTLRYVHELSRAEVAATLGLTEMQVKGHLQYALKLLRAALVARG
jgi:RNA polymerase sigma-70 factor, ECF subfamily